MEKEEINKKLLQKLFTDLVPNHDNKYFDKYFNYFLRLFNSRFNAAVNNEAGVINLIMDKISKLQLNTNLNININNNNNNSTGLEKIERFQNLYSNLSTKKTLKRRWAILYLLFRISNDNEENFVQDSSKILNSIFQEENINMNHNMNSLNMQMYGKINAEGRYLNNNNNNNFNNAAYDIDEDEINPEEEKNISKNINKPHPIVNMTKSNKMITEKDLINDLIFVFQGIDGHYINYNSIANSYTLNPLVPFNDNIHEIASVLSELGWLYRKVNNYLKFFNESNIPSQFIQSFSFAIQNELNEYYK
jgi:hypothetical protein